MAPGPIAPPGSPTYSPVTSDAGSPAGYPQPMQPWPALSPFEHGFEQTYNDDGLWFRRTANKQRDYYINAEFISGRFRNPSNARIGANADLTRTGLDPTDTVSTNATRVSFLKDGVIAVSQGRYFVTNTANNAATTQVLTPAQVSALAPSASAADVTFPVPVGGIQLGYDLLDAGTLTIQELSRTSFFPVTGGVLGSTEINYFGSNAFTTGQYQNQPSQNGMRLNFGAEDEDQSGFELTGWWLGGGPQLYRNGTGAMDTPRVTNALLLNAPELGVPNGVLAMTYNVKFQLEHETEAAVTDLQFFQTPTVDMGWLRLRTSLGARYNYIRESFSFLGIDNGQEIVYGAFGQPLVAADGSALVNSVNAPGTFVDPNTGLIGLINPYQTQLDMKIYTHLYGPQVAMNMQMGGDTLMFSGTTKFSLAANTQRLSLNGNGAGNTQAITGQIVNFNDEQTHTSISPVVELNLNADLNIFPHIPILKRSNLLRNARLRGGWTGMAVFEMARPIDSINWRTETLGGPYISNTRGTWYTDYWNVGVNWTF